MTSIKIEVEFEIDDNMWCAYSKDEDETSWFWDELLPSALVILHSNEVGDSISEATKFIVKEIKFNTKER